MANAEILVESEQVGARPASEDELEAIRDSATRALADAGCAEVMRALLDTRGDCDRSLWRVAAQLGWFGIGISEDVGGFGLDIAAQCVIAEAAGGALAAIPYVQHGAATAALARSNDVSARALVEAAVAGEAMLTAISAAGRDPSRLPVLENGRLSGHCPAVVAAAYAHRLILPCRDGRLVSVALDQLGVERRTIDSIDNSRGYADLTFTNADAIVMGDAAASERLLDELALLTALNRSAVRRPVLT